MGRLSRHLVTGYGGFLGSAMYRFLDRKGYFVISSCCDFRDYDCVLEITKGVDYLWNFSADMGGIGYFSEANYYPPINNFLIDLNILRACEVNKVKRLFYPASACAYPVPLMNSGTPLLEESLDNPAEPDQMYGWEKLTMIKLMKNSPVDCRIGVLHTIYGEGQEYEGKKAKFPPQMAYKAIRAKKTGRIEVWGNGEQTRTFLYVKDAVERIYNVMMANKNHTPVNIGSDKEVSINEIVNLCCEILKIRPKIKHLPDKPTGPERRVSNNSKFYKYFGKKRETPLKKGFENIINYIKKYV